MTKANKLESMKIKKNHNKVIKKYRKTKLPIFIKLASITAALLISTQLSFPEPSASEYARRTQLLGVAREAVVHGYKLLAAEQYAAAANRFRFVINNLTEAPATAEVYRRAVTGLVLANTQLARKAFQNRDFQTALDLSREVLGFDPKNKDMQEIMVKSSNELGLPVREIPSNLAPAMTQDFLLSLSRVNRFFDEAASARNTGQLDKADDRYRKILVIDPYNVAAREGIKEVARLKNQYYQQAKEQTREKMLYEVESGWSNPIRKSLLISDIQQSGASATRGSNIARMVEKLNNIIIDQISFEDTELERAIALLRDKARSLDPEGTGVNLIVKPSNVQANFVTVSVSNLPLSAVLDIISDQVGLVYRVEEYAVYIAASEENIEDIITREFRVPPDFFPPAVDNVEEQREQVKSRLEQLGVTFPEGTFATYQTVGSKLIVSNTFSNIQLIEQALQDNAEVIPQVNIASRLMEVNQKDLDELSFRWNINRRNKTQNQFTDTPGLRTSAPSFDPGDTFAPLPSELSVAGNAIVQNAIDGLLGQALGSLGPIGQALQAGFALSRYQFELLVYALSQKTGSDLIAVPSVTVRSGQEAEIKIIRELFVPEEYENAEFDGNTTLLPNGTVIRLVIPSTPTTFKNEETGVILSATPQVAPDRLTIDLTLKPQVLDFEGFINYGSPISTLDFNSGRVTPLVQNVINKPVFSLRQVETKIQISDGQTVAIGGLIRDDYQQVNDKIPFLGDIPLLGRLFRSKIEQSIKKNLIIFVTCDLVRPDGEPFNLRGRRDQDLFSNTPVFDRVERWAFQPTQTGEKTLKEEQVNKSTVK
jgi:general secretion pathway protein D